MATKNVTLRLDEDLLKKWRRLALEMDTSLSQWVSEAISKTLSEDQQFEAARKKALRWLEKGLPLGGKPLSREECHDR